MTATRIQLGVLFAMLATAPAAIAQPMETAAGGDGGGMQIDGARAVSSTTPRNWLSVGPMFTVGDENGGGLRAEVDVLASGPWSLGVSLSKTNVSDVQPMRDFWFNNYSISDLKAVTYVARTLGSGPVTLRAALGAGVVRTHAQGNLYQLTYAAGAGLKFDDSRMSATAEGTLAVVLQHGNWGFQFGPVISAYSQAFSASDMGPWTMPTTVSRRPLDTLVWLGLRRAL